MSALPALCLLFLLMFAGCSAPGIYHSVQSGETLGQIARAYGCSETQLARVNGIDSPQSLAKGARLFIPGATTLRTIPLRGGEGSKTRKESAENAPRHLPPPQERSVDKAREDAKRTAGQRHSPPKPLVSKGSFSWPLQGEILRRFGDQKPFPCKGIEVTAPTGTPVLAAAAGRVIYSGDGISSFGNMIILRHDGDFYTVYAFLQKNLVKVGSFVSQKERIALSGLSPQRHRPLLYFELRHHKEPVDPTFYLP